MESLAELRAKIAELTRQADELVRLEKASVIDDVRKKIHDYNLSARDLGLDVTPSLTGRGRPRGAGRAGRAEPKYRDQHGNEWSGGRGRKPAWVMQIIEAGDNIEDYRIRD